jgi:hypothetical protein
LAALVSDDLSRVRNAARDLADDFLRFERSAERMMRAVTAAGGADNPAVAGAVREACTGDRARAMNVIAARMDRT